MMLTLDDLLIAARTCYGEARGEPKEGKLAVCHVLMNRWRSTTGQWAKDDTLAKTCLRPWQFSAWNSNDPNLQRMLKADLNDLTFRECMICVLEAYNNPQNDATKGSRHYKVSSLKWPHSWGQEQQPVVIIGNHSFYNNIP